MKKIAAILLSLSIAVAITGCKNKEQTPDDEEIPTPTPLTTGIPTPAVKKSESGPDEQKESEESWMPGFEDWDENEVVIALNKVLNMEADMKVVIGQKDGETINFIDCRLDKIKQIDGFDFEEYMVPDEYAVIDMDKDGMPEVVVELTADSDFWYMVLRYYNGKVYGYSFTGRAFQGIREDGRYLASNGAGDNKILELGFEGYTLKENCLAYSERLNDKAGYCIADEKVTEEQYNEFYDGYYYSNHAAWQLFPSHIRAGYNAQKLFVVEFKAITRAVAVQMDSYSSSMESYNDLQFNHKNRIPQELIDIILKSMQSGNEDELASMLVTGTELTKEDFIKLTGFKVDDMGYVFPFRIDIDNDGADDIICQYYRGGTGGFSSMELFKGIDGIYEGNNHFECLLQEFRFLSYQGQNYLLMKNFDYNSKYFSGYNLYLYSDGTLSDGVNFSFEIEDYDTDIIYENTVYHGIGQVKKTLLNKDLPKVLENNEGVIFGTAEKTVETADSSYNYSTDIDNNGKPENYYKAMWYPSNMGTVMECMYSFEDSIVLEDLWLRLSEETGEGRLYTFWLDRIDDKNILYLYIGKNLDFSLYAFMLESAR